MTFSPTLILACATALGGNLTAQTLQAEYTILGPYGSIGSQISATPDLDADGLPDILVAGELGLFSYSSASHAELSFHELGEGSVPGNLLGVPDVNADGLPDILLAIGLELRMLSRADGSTLWNVSGSGSSSLGGTLELIDDVDGDGLPDIVTGDQLAQPGGIVRAGSAFVYSSASGAELLRLDGTGAFQDFGSDVTALSDVDADGHPEIATVFGDHEIAGVQHARVQVFDAVDGGLVHDIVIAVPSHSSSIAVAGLGDVNADGLDDLAIAYLLEDIHEFELAVHSGADGSQLWFVDPILVSRLFNVGDVDADGIDDLMAASASFSILSNGSAFVMSGADGSHIEALSGANATDFSDVAAIGDVTGDGKADVLTSGPDNPTYQAIGGGYLRDIDTEAFVAVFRNDPGGDLLGRNLTYVDDRTGDGARDVLLLGVGSTALFDGASGALVEQLDLDIPSIFPFSQGPTGLAELSDLDGDGIRDIVVGNASVFPLPGNEGTVQILSGADNSILHEVVDASAEILGLHIAVGHDENGDGILDLWVSASGRDAGFVNTGAVDLLSGADLSFLRSVAGPEEESSWFGHSLDVGGDADFDGIPDLVVGSDQGAHGSVHLISGADGSELLAVSGLVSGNTSVRGALIGDGDGDGVLDMLTAQSSWSGGADILGRVALVSTADGSEIWAREASVTGERLGSSIGAVGDVNGDGLDDVGVSQWLLPTSSTLLVLSGADGTQLDAIPLGDELVTPVIKRGGLVDAGGCEEILLGLPNHIDNGGAQLYSSSQGGNWGFIDLGLGLAGSHPVPPRLEAHGDLTGGGLKTLTVRGALPSTVTAWFLSLGRADLPFKGGTLVPSPFVAFFAGVFLTDSNGEVLVIDTPTPTGIPQGVSIWHQFAFQDVGAPVGVSLSNGLEEVFKGD